MASASYHRLAQEELLEAARYYDRESPGLGTAFVAEIETCVRAVLEHPFAGRLVIGEARRRLVRRFPYAIIYRNTGEGVRVLAIMNLRRRPTYWVGRR